MMYTIGHGHDSVGVFTEKLTEHGIEAVADVRRFPGSRRSPQFNLDVMPDWLGAEDIEYRYWPDLGGRRKPPEKFNPRDLWWQNRSFANYAAYTRTAQFRHAYRELINDPRPLVIMCGEPCWWRCHRRIIADLAVGDELTVQHIMPDGRLSEHRMSEWPAAREC